MIYEQPGDVPTLSLEQFVKRDEGLCLDCNALLPNDEKAPCQVCSSSLHLAEEYYILLPENARVCRPGCHHEHSGVHLGGQDAQPSFIKMIKQWLRLEVC